MSINVETNGIVIKIVDIVAAILVVTIGKCIYSVDPSKAPI